MAPRAGGPPGARQSRQAEHRPTRGSDGDGRERSDPCDPWGRTLAAERPGDVVMGRVPGLVSETTVSRILRALRYRKRECRDFRVRAAIVDPRRFPMARRKTPRIPDALLDQLLGG